MPAPIIFWFGCVFVMAKELGESQPGSSGTSGLGTESLQSLIQSAVDKALEAERARTVSAGLTSSGEYTVYRNFSQNVWDDEPRLSRRYRVLCNIFIGWSRARTLLMNSIQYGCHVKCSGEYRFRVKCSSSTVAVSRALAVRLPCQVLQKYLGRVKCSSSTVAVSRALASTVAVSSAPVSTVAVSRALASTVAVSSAPASTVAVSRTA